MKNTTGGLLTDTRYSRTLDWDVSEGHFDDDFLTIYGGIPTGPGSNVLHTSSNPFALPDSMVFRSQDSILIVVNAPGDLGAFFVLGFRDLADGASRSFETYIGAGRDNAQWWMPLLLWALKPTGTALITAHLQLTVGPLPTSVCHPCLKHWNQVPWI